MAGEAMTFDEILEDQVYKSEFDRRVTKALSTVQEKLNAEVEKSKDYKRQLDDANKTIEGFKDMDIDAIRKEADGWKAKAEQAEKEAAAKIAEMEFNNLLTAAIAGAKGRSANAILGELGEERMAALKSSKNQEADIKTVLEELKKDSGYLFETETPPPYAAGAGTHKLLETDPAKMTYTELCEFIAKNPNAEI